MLVAFKKVLRRHRQAFLTHFRVWRQAPFAPLMTMMVLAMVLVLPMFLWMLTQSAQHWLHRMQGHQNIVLYLKKELSEAQCQTVLAHVRAMPGVQDVDLITPEQGLSLLQEDPALRESLPYLPTNPLPASLDVLPKTENSTPQDITALFSQLKQLPEVDFAQFDLQLIMQLHGVIQCIQTITYTLMVFLGLTVVLIISNTLNLVVHKQQEELRVLKLIGASEGFILRPFLYAGLCYGLGAALIAFALVQFTQHMLDHALQHVLLAYPLHYQGLSMTWREGGSLFACALLLGWIAASISVKRQLARIEPCL